MKQKIIFIEKNTRANFVNDFIDCTSNINFIIQEGANLNYFFDQKNLKGQNQILNVNLYIYKCAKVNFSFKISEIFSTSLILNAFLVGQNADITVKGSYILDGFKKVNIITRQEHLAIDTKSEVIVRGALFENSSAYYHGTIYVDQKGSRTLAIQENKNILFSNAAKAVSIPSLEVLTDEVKCSHASAVGYFDKEYLFYMQSRGLNEQKAYELLLDTFLV